MPDSPNDPHRLATQPALQRLKHPPVVLVLMGVSGCGKTTIAKLLVDELGWTFKEGDDLHPPANVEKMHAGHPLNDEDRAPWLERVAQWIDQQLDAGRSALITCSALKRRYRDAINRRGKDVVFVYLQGSKKTIADRLADRQGHFMPATLLDSQFADLQEPAEDEPVLRVDIRPKPEVQARQIINALSDPVEHTP